MLQFRYPFYVLLQCAFPQQRHLLTLLSTYLEYTAQTSYNPPLPPDDHWGLDSPLPKYEKIYMLKRSNGVIEILDEDGKIAEQFAGAYVGKERFLRDTEKLLTMLANGPL
ncbi:unnamed protein product [Gongylonema pulchrum]|uniref:Carn_acyltransf domain-containing protein n=1 Tax=Gongylonema pulchrum TaxID=637853 RepID=A0A183D3D1_9BILA|nr:unnamed protein product [Gongylonema pulchrum]